MPPRFRFHGSIDEVNIQITGREWIRLFKYLKNRYLYVFVILLQFSQIMISPISSLLQGNLATLLVTNKFSDGVEFLNEINKLANKQFLVLVLQTVFLLISLTSTFKLITSIEANIKDAIFSSILKQEIGFFDQTESGVLLSRLTDDSFVIVQIYISNLFTVIRSIITFLIDFIILFTQSKKLTFFLVLYFPLHIFLHWITNRKSEETLIEHNKRRTKVNSMA